MPPKTLKDLKKEKEIFTYIYKRKASQYNDREYEEVEHDSLLDFIKFFDMKNKKELGESDIAHFERYYNVAVSWRLKYELWVNTIEMYRALVKEDKRLQNATNVSDDLKKVSNNNLKDYENMIASTGIKPGLLKICLVNNSYKHGLREMLVDNFVKYMNAVAKKEKIELRLSDERLGQIFYENLKDTEIKAPQLFGTEEKKILSNLANSREYFDDVIKEENTFDYETVNEMQYYRLENGHYVEKEEPTGFFSKLIYRIKRYFSDERDEVKAIEKAVANASNYAKQHDKPQSYIDIEDYVDDELEEKREHIRNEISKGTDKELISKLKKEFNKELINTFIESEIETTHLEILDEFKNKPVEIQDPNGPVKLDAID